MESILGNTRKADIVFYASGRIDITSHIATQLRLSRGDVLDIMYDEKENYTCMLNTAYQTTDMKRVYFHPTGKEIISEPRQKDCVQQFLKHPELQIKQGYA